METQLTAFVAGCHPVHLLNLLALIVFVAWEFSVLLLSFWMLSVSYIAVARTWGAVVNSNGRSRHAEPVSVPVNHPAGYGFQLGSLSG